MKLSIESSCGLCPYCGRKIIAMERSPFGESVCEMNHRFPHAKAVKKIDVEKIATEKIEPNPMADAMRDRLNQSAKPVTKKTRHPCLEIDVTNYSVIELRYS